MKYRIKYTYDTGDSFHNEYGLVGYLELEWENLEVAKANLVRIEEHYKQYEALNRNYTNKQRKDIVGENKYKDWYVESNYGDFMLKLKTDEGKDWQISAPWCGYFESLKYIEVESIDPGLKIEF